MFHLQILPNVLESSIGNLPRQIVMSPEELDYAVQLLGCGICLDRDVVDPGLHCGIEELLPFVAHVEHQRSTQKQMFEAKTGRYPAEVEEKFIFAVIFERHLRSRISIQCVGRRLPCLILRISGIGQFRMGSGQQHQRIPFRRSPRSSEEGQIQFWRPFRVFSSCWDPLSVLIPSSESRRIQRDRWSSFPETPRRIHNIRILFGFTKREYRSANAPMPADLRPIATIHNHL